MQLPDLNLPKYIGDSQRVLFKCANVYQNGNHVNICMNLAALPGNLGKYFLILGHFNNTHNSSLMAKPKTVIIGADIIMKSGGFQADFIDSISMHDKVFDFSVDIFSLNISCSVKDMTVEEVKSMLEVKFVNDLLMKMQDILARREPIATKEISISKNGVTLLLFQTFWFEDKVVFNLQNYSDFNQVKLDEVIKNYGLSVDKYNSIYKNAYKLYEHFEKISYSSECIPDIMIKIFDSVIVHIDNSCLIVNDQESIAISTDNYQTSEGKYYGFSNIIGIGNISIENLIEAAKKAESINIGREFTHYITTLLPK